MHYSFSQIGRAGRRGAEKKLAGKRGIRRSALANAALLWKEK